MPTQTTTVTEAAGIPPLLQPYVSSMLTNVSNLTNPNLNPYAGLGSYYNATGQTPFAQFNPLQRQAATESAGLGPSEYLGQGADMAGTAGLGSMNVAQNYLNAAGDPTALGAYMSPYMQNVVDRQKQGAIQDYARTIPGMGANAARAGALGGTRNALVQAEAQRGLYDRMADIQAQGTQSAFQNAQDILNRGAQFGMQGYGQALQGAGILGNLGQQQFGQQLQAIQQRQGIGQNVFNTESDVARARFADYQAMMNDPLAKMGIFSGILRNVPVQGGTTTTREPGGNTLSDIAGLGTGIGALYNIFRTGSQP